MTILCFKVGTRAKKMIQNLLHFSFVAGVSFLVLKIRRSRNNLVGFFNNYSGKENLDSNVHQVSVACEI